VELDNEMGLNRAKETESLDEAQAEEDKIDAAITRGKMKAVGLRSKGFATEAKAEDRKIESMQLAKLAFEKRRRDHQRKQCTIHIEFALSVVAGLSEGLRTSKHKVFLGDCENLKGAILEASLSEDANKIRCDLIAAAAESVVPIHHRMALDGCSKEHLSAAMVAHKALSIAAVAGLDADALDMKIQAAMLLIDAVGVGHSVISTLRGTGAEDDAKKVEAVMAHLDQARKGKFEFSVTISEEKGQGGQDIDVDATKKALTKEMSTASGSRLRRSFNKKATKGGKTTATDK